VLLLEPSRSDTLRRLFLPDRPGPLVGLHAIQTGNGALFVDRWPDPRGVLARTGGNYSLVGDPEALAPEDLAGRVSGMVHAPERFVPLLERSFPDLVVWERIILELPERPTYRVPPGCAIRRLDKDDAHHLWGLGSQTEWISDTWGGPRGLASSGTGWGAFVEDRLVSVAVPFYVGDRYEDIGVVTESDFRGRGLSAACAGRVAEDILERGRRASWSTSPDNEASLRVAEKVGFEPVRDDRLYVVGQSVPEPARREPADPD
jgi:RimJ/RimL family protein N-acetyltransferase